VLELENLDAITDSSQYRAFSVPFPSHNLRIETNSKIGVLIGKIRVSCQDVEAKLDLASVAQSKNTVLDVREDELTEGNLIYVVPQTDETINTNFGSLSFFESKKDAIFK
jgi:hypothetical protein